MPSVAERNAAFDAVKTEVHKQVPPMFLSYVNDKLILSIVDLALNAAEKHRAKDLRKTSKSTPS